MKDKLNIVIVGGGSTWCPGILKALTKHMDILPLNRVMLYDIDAERQRPIGEFGKILFAEEEPGVEFGYTTDKDEAYTDVDFVLCQIRTGGYEMRSKDEKIPLHMGIIGQETVGPGGMAYGMRSMHDMVEIVNDVRAHSPEAWIINYTNPAAIVAYGLERVLPDEHRVLNICDQPVNLMRSYGRLLGRDMSKTEPVYFGLNHFGWFTKIYDKQGRDRLPELRQMILEHGMAVSDKHHKDKDWMHTWGQYVKIVKDYPEYLPNSYLQYYLYSKDMADDMDPNWTRADNVINGREKEMFAEHDKYLADPANYKSPVQSFTVFGDFIVDAAASIAYNKCERYLVIVENNGAIPNLPDDAMVEVPAYLRSWGPEPISQPAIPTFYKGLIEEQNASEKLAVDAYYEHSYQKALEAIAINKTVPSTTVARQILDDLIEANGDYWPTLS